jgi:hypothetical protein
MENNSKVTSSINVHASKKEVFEKIVGFTNKLEENYWACGI